MRFFLFLRDFVSSGGPWRMGWGMSSLRDLPLRTTSWYLHSAPRTTAEAVCGIHMNQTMRAWQNLLILSFSYLSFLPPCSQREQWKMLLNKNPQVLVLLSLCCPHLHLVTVPVFLVRSEALRLGSSTIAISLVWTFSEIYSILDDKPAWLPICDHAFWHFFYWTFWTFIQWGDWN